MTTQGAAFVEPTIAVARSGRLRDTFRALLGQRSAVVGLSILAVFVFAAVFAEVIAPYPAEGSAAQLVRAGEPGRRAQPCIHLLGCPADKPETIFGTDGNSRDVFSRVVFGARRSLIIGFATVGLAIIVGTTIGAISGFAGGLIDNLLMRMMDVVLAFPALLLAIVIVTMIGQSLVNAMMAIAIVAIPVYARVMRASVLSVKEQDFVTAARALGESPTGILTRRILPNALTPLIVIGTLGIASAVLDVAALSFLGLTEIGIAEWGAMIGSEFNGIFSRPLIVLAPGFALTLTVLGFNLLGDGLRDALDPRLSR
jgi:ABC-type dipeptide/oligopeptide/nickel transport system permease subunit